MVYMSSWARSDNTVRVAFINNKEVNYDFCGKDLKGYDDVKNIQYLGFGFIYTINGIIQEGFDNYHFWKRGGIT